MGKVKKYWAFSCVQVWEVRSIEHGLIADIVGQPEMSVEKIKNIGDFLQKFRKSIETSGITKFSLRFYHFLVNLRVSIVNFTITVPIQFCLILQVIAAHFDGISVGGIVFDKH